VSRKTPAVLHTVDAAGEIAGYGQLVFRGSDKETGEVMALRALAVDRGGIREEALAIFTYPMHAFLTFTAD